MTDMNGCGLSERTEGVWRGRSYRKTKTMFKIRKVRPLFTGIVTTAKKYVGETTTAGGVIIDTTRMEGSLNPFQTVVSVGAMCKDVKPGDVVKINFKRYAKANHAPGAIDEAQNKQFDSLSVVYEIPMINLDGQECLFIQSNDVEYVVEDFEVDEGGLLQ